MKTAVQKLIEHFEEMYSLNSETMYEFKKALKEEREQIEDAFDEGGFSRTYKNSSDYYSQTFKND